MRTDIVRSIVRFAICFVLAVCVAAAVALRTSATNAMREPRGDGPVPTSMPKPIVHPQANATRSCLPRYGEHQFILRVNEAGPRGYEPFVTPADLNGDGLEDVVITKMTFQTTETYELDILLNDGNGSLALATSGIFVGTIPAVQHPRQVILADLNGDGVADIYVADHGYDAHPFPGYQNTLVLSAPNGKVQDATGNLPQQRDFTHSACAADIDDDEDVDLYVGNIWGQNDIDPQILLNNGSGRFTVGENRLPPLVDLNQNGYTTCEFGDVNNDGSPDLILGDAGDDIANEHSTPDSEILLNDGWGVFTLLPNALPPKSYAPSDIAHDIQPIHLDGDAYVDLLLVYERQPSQGSYIQALVNNGDGTFRDESGSRLGPLGRQVWIPELELRDVDRDGDPDLLARPWDDADPNPLLFLNDGSGHLHRAALDFGLTYLYYTFLDLDGDSGHDIVFATFAPPEDIYAIRDVGCPVFLPLICRNAPAGS